MKKRFLRPFPFHPILIGIYPILYLLASNINQVRPAAALRAGAVSLVSCLVLYGLLWAIVRSPSKAAPLASLWLVLLYSYGHIYQVVEGKSWMGVVYGKHRFLIILWAALFIAGSAWIIKRVKGARPYNQILNVMSVVLVVLPVIQISWFAYRFQRESAEARSIAQDSTPAYASVQDQPGPDIYYIILDGYSRADVLKMLYNLDISPFMEEMKSMGFVFPDCTQSNYGMTAFSMISALNMEYMDAFPDALPAGSDDEQVDTSKIFTYIRQSKVRQLLEQQGYQVISFETDYWWLNLEDADMYIVGNDNPLAKYNPGNEISSFEEMYLRTTALRILSETSAIFTRQVKKQIRTPNQRQYEVTRFALDQVEKIPAIPGKKFVYFHLIAPHAPFVFDQDGNFVDYDQRNGTEPGYPNEVVYLNKRIVQVVRALLANSKTPPIIIIQGDHGWDPRYRNRILNAYYLPDGGDLLLYPTITPVNTFRLIFYHYFGGDYDFLKDESYFSIGESFPQYGIVSRPYQLIPVSESCMSK